MDHKNERIIVVTRHGEQCRDHGLTKFGEEQVQRLANTLSAQNFKPDLIIPSYPKRTMKSASILQRHFQMACAEPVDFLNTYAFDMNQFFSALPDGPQTILITGHDETIQCFGHHLLDDADTARLFSKLPENRKIQHDFNTQSVLAFTAHHADALIFAQNLNDKHWRLHSLIMDGRNISIDQNNAPAMHGKKYIGMPDFPEILLELSE